VNLRETGIAGAWVVEHATHSDPRGLFARTFCLEEFAAAGLVTMWAQASRSFNRRRGTLRGLHFQAAPFSETKLVRVTRGAILDVIADLRPGAGFRRVFAIELSADGDRSLYIPPGCAHGFQTLADETEVDYHITPAYRPEAARGIRWDDPSLGIAWPLPVSMMSERDRTLPLLAELEPA
jgi:dTDP-4-dehydrorhamnose 3,5-epimerase